MAQNNSDEESRKYINHYDNTNKFFLPFVGYAVLFFLIIVLPYFFLINEEPHLVFLQKLEKNILEIKGLQDGINLNFSSFLNQTKNFNFESNQSQAKLQSYEDIKVLLLRSKSLALRSDEVLANLILKMTKSLECAKETNMTNWIDCNAKRYYINNNIGNFTKNVIKVRKNTIASLNNTVDRVVKRIQNITENLAKDEQQSSDDFIKKNVNSTNRFLNDTAKRLEQLRTDRIKKLDPNALSGLPEMFQKISQISTQLTSFDRNLTMERTIINQKRQNLETNLQGIQAPFLGKVPVGLDDAILVFPITLSIGSLIFTSLLNKVINSGEKVADDIKNSVSLVLYPEQWSRGNLIRFVVIFIPVIIFGVTLFMIYDIWINHISDLLHTDYLFVYNVLYGLSISVVCITYTQILLSIPRKL